MRGWKRRPAVTLSTRKPENPVILVNVKLPRAWMCARVSLDMKCSISMKPASDRAVGSLIWAIHGITTGF